MKKIITFILLMIVLVGGVNAKSEINFSSGILYKAELINSLDAENAWFKVDGNVIRTRLLAYDEKTGVLNSEIDSYVSEILKNATSIEIEFDPLKLDMDEYNRYNVYVYVDGHLLQSDLISKGYGSVNFVTDNYKHLDTLCEMEKTAIINDAGIWNYDGIKEDYCKSGIEIGSDHTIYKEELKENTKKDNKNLRYLVLINSGVVLLSVLLIFRRRN